jgi:hypothetical protein
MRSLVALITAIFALPLWADPSTTSVQQGALGGLEAKFVVAASADKQKADGTFRYWIAMPNGAFTRLVLELEEVVFAGATADDPSISCNILDCFSVGFEPFLVDDNETLFIAANREILSLTLNTQAQNALQPLATLAGLFVDCEENLETVETIFGDNYRNRFGRTRLVMAGFPPALQTNVVPECVR